MEAKDKLVGVQFDVIRLFSYCYLVIQNKTQSGFKMTVENSNTKVITWTRHSKGKQCDEPIRITISNYLELAQSAGKWCLQVAIGFGFVSHWLKNWRENLKPITKRTNRNRVITFNSHLKTALKMK